MRHSSDASASDLGRVPVERRLGQAAHHAAKSQKENLGIILRIVVRGSGGVESKELRQ